MKVSWEDVPRNYIGIDPGLRSTGVAWRMGANIFAKTFHPEEGDLEIKVDIPLNNKFVITIKKIKYV
jgi:hypothetical protein